MVLKMRATSPVWGWGRRLEVESGINQNLDPTFVFDLYAHQRLILHHFRPMHISYRQMDRHCASSGDKRYIFGVLPKNFSLFTDNENKNANKLWDEAMC